MHNAEINVNRTCRDFSAIYADMTFNDRLKAARERKGYKSAAKAAAAMGAPYGTYSGHENGSRGAKRQEIIRYAKFFGVNPAWLEYGEGELSTAPVESATPSIAQVHIRGSVQAGTWNEFEEFPDADMETVPTVMGKWAGYEQFAYKITGPSMNQARIFDGDFVVCVPYFLAAKGHKTGDLVVVERRRGGLVERTVKQVDFSNGDCKLWPRSDDPRFQLPIPCKGPEPDGTEIEIIGLVIWVCRPL